ncbi:cyclodeaminase/cyclohydrolase family protein [Treponema primitia]|uniref:cyclodeaminase/cyclohydrolase family protein n=1 Tax=Treponema primitia TaxID=88058 RepID=UPI0039810161
MLIDLPVHEFIQDMKSDSPAPGGGSASALAGALSAALGIMVTNLTTGNTQYAGVEKRIRELRTELESVLKDLERYVDEDTFAFNDVMAAYKLPKEGDEEKAIRRDRIQSSMKTAAELPLLVAGSCLRALTAAVELLRIGNSNAASDAAVSGRLAYAALWGAVYNVRINLGSIKDAEFNRDKRAQITALLKKGEELTLELSRLADEKMP